MRKKRSQVKTDPELMRQLETTATEDELVQAVFTLRLPTKQLLVPRRVEEVTHEVLERVSQQMGIDAAEVNIFRNLGAFAISAPSSFIRELLSEPEIASAISNEKQQPAPFSKTGS